MPARSRVPVLHSTCPPFRALLRQARRYAHTAATILITGETGSGKDALARYIHRAGPRRPDPFVAIDCPAIPATLFEAELFGHERGAFTDATVARAGPFERAGRGTVYLDGVTGLELPAQGALLRVVEERRLTRIGGTVPIDLRARLIASGDATLVSRVAAGSFRPDLFHRLCVLPLHVPPLRHRQCDIIPLAHLFIREMSAAAGCEAPGFTRDAEAALLRHDWPGNVRELRHVVERALLSTRCDRIGAHDLVLDRLDPRDYLDGREATAPTLEEVERDYIAATLQRTNGNLTRAAAILGISRKSLWERRRRFGWL